MSDSPKLPHGSAIGEWLASFGTAKWLLAVAVMLATSVPAITWQVATAVAEQKQVLSATAERLNDTDKRVAAIEQGDTANAVDAAGFKGQMTALAGQVHAMDDKLDRMMTVLLNRRYGFAPSADFADRNTK